jgi:hypothetical protein
MELINMETYQMVNISFLRLQLAIFCRECINKRHPAQGDLECKGCRLNEVRTYLDDPGQQVSEMNKVR